MREKVKVHQGTIIKGLMHQHKLFGFCTPHSEAIVQEFLPDV